MLFSTLSQGWIFLSIFSLGIFIGLIFLFISNLSKIIKKTAKKHRKTVKNSKKMINFIKKQKNIQIIYNIKSVIKNTFTVIFLGLFFYLFIYFFAFGEIRLYQIFAYIAGFCLIQIILKKLVVKKAT